MHTFFPTSTFNLGNKDLSNLIKSKSGAPLNLWHETSIGLERKETLEKINESTES